VAAQVDPLVPALQEDRQIEELVSLRRTEVETELRESRVENPREVSQGTDLGGFGPECST
jgi:hypothetical protein